MGFDSSLRRKVRQLARDKRSEVKDEDFFSSYALLRYLNGLATTMLKGARLGISVIGDENCGITAQTNQSEVLINWKNAAICYYPELEQRFVCFMGIFFHELAHVLFLDFNEEMNAQRYLANGFFYGDSPSGMNAEEEGAWTDILKALQNPLARKIFMDLFHSYSNVIADRHDEDSMMDLYGSFVAEGIYLARSSLHARSLSFEEMNDRVLSGQSTDLILAHDALLQYTRFGFVLCDDPYNLENSPFGKILNKIKPHADIACVTDDVARKQTEIQWILLYLWPFIRAEIQKLQDKQNQQGQQSQQNQQGQPDSGQPSDGGTPPDIGDMLNQLTEEQVQSILDQLSQGGQSMQSQPNPSELHSSQTAIDRRAAERNGEQREHKEEQSANSGSGTDQLAQALNNIADSVAQSNAESEMEQESSQAMCQKIMSCSQTSPHQGIKLRYERPLAVTEADKARYEQIMKDLLPISKRLQRQIVDALRDLKEGYVQKHRLIGKDLVPGDTYRPDGRFFSSKVLPQDLPDMAISILVDESGSMSSGSSTTRESKITSAMRAAMLLYDFATGINIPVSVAGHHAGDGVTYEVYTDFERVNDNDKFRLPKMATHGCNRDGMALNVAAGLLEQRPEQVKLLIIISDGRPNHDNYGGDGAAEDIRAICKSCKRKGIEVIAAAIGDDRKAIQDIYRDQFLDISDLSKLPKIFVDIVKKRILRNAL